MRNSLTALLSLAANSEKKESIYKVPYKHIVVDRIRAHFPDGGLGDITLALYYGDMKVFPRKGFIYPTSNVFDERLEAHYFLGDDVLVYWKNINTTSSYRVVLDLEFEVLEV